MRYGHGLVIGKFYPPTLGHDHLIRAAARQAVRVTVVVMAERYESIRLADRVRWLRAEHDDDPRVSVVGVPCDIPVDYEDSGVWAAQVAVIAAAARSVTTDPVDVVFSSEIYGAELGEWFAAAHVLVDRERLAVPVSASQVRSDLTGSWYWLGPAVRAGLATRVVVVGAESTGTTTVAQKLVDHYRERGGIWNHTQLVAEYGREFTETKWAAACRLALDKGEQEPPLDTLVWQPADFDVIATQQRRLEEISAMRGSPLLICDTDAFATAVWERRYLGGAARLLESWATNLPGNRTYLITDHSGVPWVDDGIREGDLRIRAAMTGWFIDALTAAGHSWVLLSGTLEQRLQLAVRTCDQLLARAAIFCPPIS